jgi:hypothetical protein
MTAKNQAALYADLLKKFNDKAPSFGTFQAFSWLAGEASLRGYDQWVTKQPPILLTHEMEHELPVVSSQELVTASGVQQSLNRYMASMLCRDWDIESPVWLARNLSTKGDGHYSDLLPGEQRIHSDLAAIRVSTGLVLNYLNWAGRNPSYAETIRAKTLLEIDKALPLDSGSYQDGYRNALESIILALEAEGVSAKAVAKSVTTALDAYANYAESDGEDFDPAPVQAA